MSDQELKRLGKPQHREIDRELLDMKAKLKRVQEFAADLERKGKDCRELLRQHPVDPTASYVKERLVTKASTYEEEARRLRAILVD